MTDMDPNDVEMSDAGSQSEWRDNGQSSTGRGERPYGNAGNLYEIPRVRPDDPPKRDWWMDDDEQ